jgi:hypothetical protein
MTGPQVTEEGDGLQIWRVAANILNKQSRTNNKGWSYSLGIGHGDNNSSPYKISLLRYILFTQHELIKTISSIWFLLPSCVSLSLCSTQASAPTTVFCNFLLMLMNWFVSALLLLCILEWVNKDSTFVCDFGETSDSIYVITCLCLQITPLSLSLSLYIYIYLLYKAS